MARDIPVGNGDLLITFDLEYRVRDLYFPRVGQPNHTDGHVQRFGVWADGKFAWIEDESWERHLRYRPGTLVTEVTLKNESMGIELVCNDAVDFTDPVYLRRTEIRDLGRPEDLEGSGPRDVRVFFHYDLSIDGNPFGDTTNYDPSTNALVMYKNESYFLINAGDHSKTGIDIWSIGTKRLGGAEGTWRDAEDGELGGNAISQGSVDATIGVRCEVPEGGSSTFTTWVACGHSYEEVRELNDRISEQGPNRFIKKTAAYWSHWESKEKLDLSALPERVRDLFTVSQLVLRTQIDNGGAIIAANDSDIAQFGGDHYSYCWPRDGALCAHSLIVSGQSELSRAFFRFAARVIEPSGYFLHKYNPSGTLASSWHPWTIKGQRVLPIQQDETSLTLWALRQHFETYRDVEFIKSVYEPLVSRPADWILEYRDTNGLPHPSWDLWEERRGVSLFTVGATIGALRAAAQFADEFGDIDRAARCRDGAADMTRAMIKHMRDSDAFARMVTPLDDGSYRLDMTPDSSNYGIFAFGALAPDDDMVISEMQRLHDKLWVQTEVGGCARYSRDYYHQVETENVEMVPGNPWIICTLWHAQHMIATAKTVDDLDHAMNLLNWATYRTQESGVLAEQFHPYSGEPLSVSPLSWSHSTFIIATIEYLAKRRELETGRSIRVPSDLGLDASSTRREPQVVV